MKEYSSLTLSLKNFTQSLKWRYNGHFTNHIYTYSDMMVKVARILIRMRCDATLQVLSFEIAL